MLYLRAGDLVYEQGTTQDHCGFASGMGIYYIAREALQKDSTKFIRFSCCGKGIHKWCDEEIKVSSLSQEQKRSCPLCLPPSGFLRHGQSNGMDKHSSAVAAVAAVAAVTLAPTSELLRCTTRI